MPTRNRAPALGAEGWFTLDEAAPALLGHRCETCGTWSFGLAPVICPNPACGGDILTEAELARVGSLWSYTDARYQPPAPYVVPGDEHEPFALAAVSLAEEGLVILGQVVADAGVDDLTVGQPMEVVLDVLFSDDETDHLIWKWAPVDHSATRASGAGGVTGVPGVPGAPGADDREGERG